MKISIQQVMPLISYDEFKVRLWENRDVLQPARAGAVGAATVNRNDELSRAQREHWSRTYTAHPGMYGQEPSEPARYAAERFAAEGARHVLELGSGHGRDALYFARCGFEVTATDFSPSALTQLVHCAAQQNTAGLVRTLEHGVRDRLPPEDESTDGVFAHMLLCMALSTGQIRALVGEVRRVLRPGGVFIYTVRHTGDTHYGAGTCHGDDIYEHSGFAVHYFNRCLVDELAKGCTSPRCTRSKKANYHADCGASPSRPNASQTPTSPRQATTLRAAKKLGGHKRQPQRHRTGTAGSIGAETVCANRLEAHDPRRRGPARRGDRNPPPAPRRTVRVRRRRSAARTGRRRRSLRHSTPRPGPRPGPG